MTLYVDSVEADAYFRTRPFSELWFSVPIDTKIACLTLAQKHIDSLPLIGKKLDYSQENQFPRYYYTDGYVDYTVIPQEVKEAVCEEAFAILKYLKEERYALREQGVTNASRGGLSESYEKYLPLDIPLSFEAKRLMQKWIVSNPKI